MKGPRREPPRKSGSFKPGTLDRAIEDIQTANAQMQTTLAMYSSLVNTYFPDELDTLHSVQAATNRLIATSANTIVLARQGAKGSEVIENLEKIETLEGDFLRVLNRALEDEKQEALVQLAQMESNFARGEFAALAGGGYRCRPGVRNRHHGV